MKTIKLTQNQSTLVDNKWFKKLNRNNWYYSKHKTWNTGYAIGQINKTKVKMHRYIMSLEGFDIKNKTIDHINGDGLDNRMINLRIATKQQNSHNCQIPKNNKSGYKGVIWEKQSNKWKAYIHLNNKMINLGRFDNKIDAANTYNNAAIKYFGEFARLNVIQQ